MKYLSPILSVLVLLSCSNGIAQETDFSTLDADSDGKVSVAEFESYAETKLPGFENLEQFAAEIDKNGDGEISKDEFASQASHMKILQTIMAEAREQKSDDAKEKKGPESKGKLKSDIPKDSAARSTFEKMSKLLATCKLKDASEFMTKNGQDEFCSVQLVSAIGMTKIELPMPMPGLDEAIDEIENVLVKYELDKLDFAQSKMFRVEMSIDGSMDEEEDESSEKESDKGTVDDANKEMDDASSKILKAVDKDGKRWEIMAELLDARKGSPFGMNPLSGKVSNFDMADKETALLEITPVPSDNKPGNGMLVQMAMPPSVIRMKKVNDDWKYDGTDHERTNQAMVEFMKKQQQDRFGGGAEPRADF